MVRSPGTTYSEKWLLCQGLRQRERNSVSNAQRPVRAALVSDRSCELERCNYNQRCNYNYTETQRQKVRIGTLTSFLFASRPSANLNRSLLGKGDWMQQVGISLLEQIVSQRSQLRGKRSLNE